MHYVHETCEWTPNVVINTQCRHEPISENLFPTVPSLYKLAAVEYCVVMSLRCFFAAMSSTLSSN